MASSLELNKLVAGVLTAGVIAVGSGVVASILYHPRGLEENAFSVIDEGDEGAETVAAADAPAEESLPVLLASADPAAGETLSRQCTACHVFQEGGDNRVGPGLWNVVGADIAAHDGFAYSDALLGIEGDWTFEALDGFLAAPRDWAPGTAMSYAGIRDAQDRANMIAYLQTLSNDPVPLPEPSAEEPAAEEPAAEETAAAEEPAAEEAVAEEAPVEEPAATDETAVAEAEAAEAGEAEVAAADAPAESEETAVVEAEADEAAEADAAAAEAPAQSEEVAAVEAEETVVAEAETDQAAEMETAAADVPAESEEAAVAEAEAEAPAAEAAGGASPMVEMVAAADPSDGERLFRQCAACHVADQGGANRVGPGLWGVFGADIASHDGFNYSDALQGIEGDWTVDKLNAYLENPRGFAPGNRMAFAGLRSEEDRAAMIAYLHSLSENPVPLQ
jgi:cytochrome c2